MRTDWTKGKGYVISDSQPLFSLGNQEYKISSLKIKWKGLLFNPTYIYKMEYR